MDTTQRFAEIRDIVTDDHYADVTALEYEASELLGTILLAEIEGEV